MKTKAAVGIDEMQLPGLTPIKSNQEVEHGA